MAQLAAGQFEKIATGLYLEGLAVDYARDVIWYSDVIGGGIPGIKPDTILSAEVVRKRDHDYAPKTLPDVKN